MRGGNTNSRDILNPKPLSVPASGSISADEVVGAEQFTAFQKPGPVPNYGTFCGRNPKRRQPPCMLVPPDIYTRQESEVKPVFAPRRRNKQSGQFRSAFDHPFFSPPLFEWSNIGEELQNPSPAANESSNLQNIEAYFRKEADQKSQSSKLKSSGEEAIGPAFGDEDYLLAIDEKLIQKYKKMGHHWVSEQIRKEFYKNGWLTEEANKVWKKAVSGRTKPDHGNIAYGGVKHSTYNKEIKEVAHDYYKMLKKNGKLINGKMTKVQATDFLDWVVSRGAGRPNISKFNSALKKTLIIKGAFTAFATGIVFSQIESQVKALEDVGKSQSFKLGLKYLQKGEIGLAGNYMIHNENSLYEELIDKGHKEAAQQLKIRWIQLTDSLAAGKEVGPRKQPKRATSPKKKLKKKNRTWRDWLLGN